MARLRWLGFLCVALLLADCGGGSGSATRATPPLLTGDSQSSAQSALPTVAPLRAVFADTDGEVLLTRISVVLTATATVGDINAAGLRIGATGFAYARSNSPYLTLAVPRQVDGAALDALAAKLDGQPGILLAVGGRQLAVKELPNQNGASAPLDELQHLLPSGFPAAWNLRSLAQANCAAHPVTVIVPDSYVGVPAPALFQTQLPGHAGEFADATTIPITPTDEDQHGFNVVSVLAGEFDATAPTGANPFPECLTFVPVNTAGLDAFSAVDALRAAVAGVGGKAVLNDSTGYSVTLCGAAHGDPCARADIDDALAPYLRKQIAIRVAAGTEWAAFGMQDGIVTNTLIAQAAGNEAAEDNQSGFLGADYPGLHLARLGSPLAAATQLANLQTLLGDAGQWTPVAAGMPVLTPDPGTITALVAEVVQLVPDPITDANFTAVGSTSNAALLADLQPSAFSNSGTDLAAVGENIAGLGGHALFGTSFAAPQVVGLASYLWLLDPGLASAPVSETLQLIRATSRSTAAVAHVLDAYAAVLALDARNGNLRIRKALLDVDANHDGKFDGNDLVVFSNAYGLDNPGTPSIPAARDYSRFDLNGDGFTGGVTTERFDLDAGALDANGAPTYGAVAETIEGFPITFNEAALSDIQILCYYAYSPLYAADAGGANDQARTALLGVNHCVEPKLTASLPGQISGTATLTGTVQVPRNGQYVPAGNVLVTFAPTCASVAPASARTDANGGFSTTVTPNPGCARVSVAVAAQADTGTPVLATQSVGASVAVGHQWSLDIDVDCPGIQGSGSIEFPMSMLNEAGEQISGSLSGGVLKPIRFSFCFTLPGVLFSATVSAKVVRSEFTGDIIGLTNVAIVPSIDATAVGKDVCKDLEIDVAGPIDGSSNTFDGFNLNLPSLCTSDINSVSLPITYTGFQLGRF